MNSDINEIQNDVRSEFDDIAHPVFRDAQTFVIFNLNCICRTRLSESV